MTYREEFPDFNPATMPPIPADWEDTSWHNDACPSFEPCQGVLVYIDYAEQQRREVNRWRFTVMDAERSDTLLETDDWDEVLRFIPQAQAKVQQQCQHRDDGRGRCIDCGAFL